MSVRSWLRFTASHWLGQGIARAHSMQLKDKGRIGGMAVVAVLMVILTVAGAGIWYIRVGGPLFDSVQRMSDLTADILPPPEYVIEPYLEVTLLDRNPERLAKGKARLAELQGEWRDRIDYWSASPLRPELKGPMESEVGKTAQDFWQDVNTGFLPAVASGRKDRIDAAYARVTQRYEAHRGAVDRLVAATAETKTELEDHSRMVVMGLGAMLIVLGLGLVAMIVLATRYVMRAALEPIALTASTMTAMADGDLEAGRQSQHRADEIGAMTSAIEVFRKAAFEQREVEQAQRQVVSVLKSALGDLAQGNLSRQLREPFAADYEELRRSWNDSLEPLGILIGDVTEAADAVSIGSKEIRAAADDLAQRNERQASFVEDTAAALEQLVEIVRDTSSGTGEVQEMIGGAHNEAETSRGVVSEAVGAMAEIETSAREITKIIAVIDGISFQTNLLALNAGVEAARAGEAGKGFAVVANEVRALAQRSAEAANDIKGLITASTTHVTRGVQLVGQTGERLGDIVERVAQANERIGTIAQSAELQAMAIAKIHESVDELDRMTQQNAAMVEQSSAAARSLSDQAGQLAGMCARFSAGGAGGTAGRESAAGADLARLVAAPEAMAPVPLRRVAPPPVAGNLALKGGDDFSDGGADWAEF